MEKFWKYIIIGIIVFLIVILYNYFYSGEIILNEVIVTAIGVVILMTLNAIFDYLFEKNKKKKK